MKKYKFYRWLLGGKWFLYQDDFTKEYLWFHNTPSKTSNPILKIENYEA